MNIIIGCDHAGYELKEQIKKYLTFKNFTIADVGACNLDPSDDFSKFVKLMRAQFNKDNNSKIIAICGTGIGMSIGLNKTKNVFSIVGHSPEEVAKAREHNNINALCLGGRTTRYDDAVKMIDQFLSVQHLGGKYQKRMEDIDL